MHCERVLMFLDDESVNSSHPNKLECTIKIVVTLRCLAQQDITVIYIALYTQACFSKQWTLLTVIENCFACILLIFCRLVKPRIYHIKRINSQCMPQLYQLSSQK